MDADGYVGWECPVCGVISYDPADDEPYSTECANGHRCLLTFDAETDVFLVDGETEEGPCH